MARRSLKPALALAALGIVFGDIGTSPLYAFRQCFVSALKVEPTHANVLGILSLILWSLILIVFVRYIGMVMRISHDGEGGILALLAFVLPPVKRGVLPKATWLTFLIVLGAGMLFGDGIITPAVSVLSSIEGIGVATPDAQPYVVPIAVVILLGLFALQKRGTQHIGNLFGPVMLLWFAAIAVLGIRGIASYPAALLALNPYYIGAFFVHHGPLGIAIFGAVVLCVSGVEALYADMSHFGRGPIALAWSAVAFPALALNYLGQGAIVLSDPSSLQNPFYALAPPGIFYVVVALAAAATIIASQALISGVFTLTKQAINLGFIPRTRVIYTSIVHRGQVYVPLVNRMLAVACIALVIGFHTSTRLANAYGLAVAVTMVVTSIAYYEVARSQLELEPAQGDAHHGAVPRHRAALRARRTAEGAGRRLDPAAGQPGRVPHRQHVAHGPAPRRTEPGRTVAAGGRILARDARAAGRAVSRNGGLPHGRPAGRSVRDAPPLGAHP